MTTSPASRAKRTALDLQAARVDLEREFGEQGFRRGVDYVTGKRIITEETRNEMRRVLAEIQSGKFAKEWVAEYKAGLPNFKRMREEQSQHLIEQTGAPLREMMKGALKLEGGSTEKFLSDK